jgi:small subunit ribosomal protein S14
MAKKSQINRNAKREKLVAQYAVRRAALKATADDMKVSPEERFEARLKLAELPRNSSKVRIHHRCELSGRPKGYYRKVKLSRIALRDLANFGQIPGMTKASW